MTHPADIIMVFDRDEELSAFPSLRAVQTWLEAIDVEDGEYVAYTADGHVVDLLAPTGADGPVVAVRTDDEDRADLERRVARYWYRYANQAALGPEETARLLLQPGLQPVRRGLRWLTGFFRRNDAAA